FRDVSMQMEFFFFSSRRRHTRSKRDWSSDVCSSDLTTTIKIGTKMPENSPEGEAFNYFADLVEEKSNGSIEVKVYPDEQLGGGKIGRASCRERVKRSEGDGAINKKRVWGRRRQKRKK